MNIPKKKVIISRKKNLACPLINEHVLIISKLQNDKIILFIIHHIARNHIQHLILFLAIPPFCSNLDKADKASTYPPKRFFLNR